MKGISSCRWTICQSSFWTGRPCPPYNVSLIRPLGLEFRVSRHFNSLTEFAPLGWLWLLLGCDQCSGARGACGNLPFATAELFSSGEDDKMQTYRIQTRCVIFIRIYLNVNGGFIHVLFLKNRFTSLKEKKGARDGRRRLPQELIDCVPNPNACGGTGGCSGATVELAMNYVNLWKEIRSVWTSWKIWKDLYRIYSEYVSILVPEVRTWRLSFHSFLRRCIWAWGKSLRIRIEVELENVIACNFLV